jgi:tetratricopeptide (TPR) repeat protein
MAISLWAVGEGRATAGDLRGARVCFEESLATNAAVGDGWVADAAKTGLARVAWADGDMTSARMLLEESTALMRAFGDARSIGLNLARLGELAQDVGDSAAARSLYRQALPIFLDTGDHGKIGDVLLGLASLAAAEGAVASAVRLAGAAAGITHAAAWIDDDHWSTRQNWLSLAQLRAVADRQLARQEVARAWAEGQTMSVEQAVAMAVAEPTST